MNAPEARLVHRAPGRLRMRIPSYRGDEVFFEATARRLAAVPGVASVQARALTGSLLLRLTAGPERVLEILAAEEILDVQERPEKRENLLDAVARAVSEADRELARSTESRLDLESAAFTGLLAATLVQLGRGEILPPAVTLMSYLSQLVGARRSRLSDADREQAQGNGRPHRSRAGH